MQGGVTITRVWMARPFQTRSRHWDIDGRECPEVAEEGWNAPGWITEQGKTLALGSGRTSCQNPEVTPLSYKLQLERLANTSFYYCTSHHAEEDHLAHVMWSCGVARDLWRQVLSQWTGTKPAQVDLAHHQRAIFSEHAEI